MLILEFPNPVKYLHFLPDGRLLAALRTDEGGGAVDIWSIPQGERSRIPLPNRAVWGDTPSLAIPPGGKLFYVCWNGRLLSFSTEDGKLLPSPDAGKAHQVIVSPEGNEFVIAQTLSWRDHQIRGVQLGAKSKRVIWNDSSSEHGHFLCGFLPDGERYVAVDGQAVRIRAFADNRELDTARFSANSPGFPVMSPDRKYLAVTGYTSMYIYDLTNLGKPRRISGPTTFGNFRSFAFHPTNSTLAIIHGGPTLVKIYDLETLKLIRKLNWKLGALNWVAFSPDGCLGAAGGEDGRIVVWDVE